MPSVLGKHPQFKYYPELFSTLKGSYLMRPKVCLDENADSSSGYLIGVRGGLLCEKVLDQTPLLGIAHLIVRVYN